MIRHLLALVAVLALSVSTVACAASNEEAADAAESSAAQESDLVAPSAKFEIFAGEDGDFYFRFVAANGELLLVSEGFATRESAESATDAVIEYAPDTRNVEILEGSDGWYFTVRGESGEVIAVSDTYSSKANADRGARTVRSIARLIRNGEG